jgi:hypothetical protein
MYTGYLPVPATSRTKSLPMEMLPGWMPTKNFTVTKTTCPPTFMQMASSRGFYTVSLPAQTASLTKSLTETLPGSMRQGTFTVTKTTKTICPL